MWADTDADVDYLNYTEVAELVAEMVGSERMLPLSLGVFGTWGTGKGRVANAITPAFTLRRPYDRHGAFRFGGLP
ncbi:hypothetical protein [Methylobacterium fujisawaense]|uniref:hypothetical protein n=1 Tax=Methylobacterium fujisawaense TaxID=107400 RepID=UPI00313B1DC8